MSEVYDPHHWIAKGFNVIVLSHEHGLRAIRMHSIESVAKQSFVVNGDRYQKDTLQSRSPSPYDPTKRVIHPGTKEGRELHAEMLLRERFARAQGAAMHFRRISFTDEKVLAYAKTAVRELTRFISDMEKKQAVDEL